MTYIGATNEQVAAYARVIMIGSGPFPITRVTVTTNYSAEFEFGVLNYSLSMESTIKLAIQKRKPDALLDISPEAESPNNQGG